jgi:hypothetical protein
MTERISASVAGRIAACPASANLDLAIPNWTPPVEDRTKDNAANRGTNVHSIFEKVWELPARELRSMAKTIDYVADLRAGRRYKVLIEHSMNATWLDPKAGPTTADLVLHTQEEIHVLDTKWGKILVEAVENYQLLYYAATYGHLAPKAKGVTVHILQPNADNFDAWFISADRLKEFMDEMRATHVKVQAKDLTFGPTDKGCQFCPAHPHSRGQKGRPMCPATMQMLYPTITDEDAILAL